MWAVANKVLSGFVVNNLKWLSLALLPGDKSRRVERVYPMIA